MSTAIEWTDETWNPVVGCTKVSQGCKHCYAKTLHDKRHKAAIAGKAVHPQYLKPFETVQLMEERLTQPLHWEKPRRCFVNSVSDVFHEDVPDEFIAQIWATMALARAHTFQVLTKRPARMATLLADPAFRELVDIFAGNLAIEQTDPANRRRDDLRATCPDIGGEYWPLPNVWLGVSVENQEAADERIPLLVQTPAAIRFLSCEPLLGPLDLDGYLPSPYGCDGNARHAGCELCGDPGLHWVIVGGESGPEARPCDVAWIEGIAAQCWEHGVPLFVKQLGKWIAGDHTGFSVDRWLFADGSIFVPPLIGPAARARPDGVIAFSLGSQKHGDPYQWPERLRVRQFPGEQVPA